MPYKNALNKFISGILIFLIIFYTPLAYSQESDPTPTPTEIVTITPTPTDGPLIQEHNNSIDEENTEILGYPTVSTDSAVLNTGDNVNQISSESSVLNIVIDNTNNATVNHQEDQTNTTGGNNLNNNIDYSGPIRIDTGDAKATATLSTIINTNVVGLNVQPIVHNLFTPQNTLLDLSSINACQPGSIEASGDIEFTENSGNKFTELDTSETSVNLGIYNTNEAHVVNDVTLTSDSGNNTASDNIGQTQIETGSATTKANVFTLANTNLVGECGFFGIINLFEGGTGSVILPYELGYVDPDNQVPNNVIFLNSGNDAVLSDTNIQNDRTEVLNQNNANINTEVTSTNQTGDNTINDAIGFGQEMGIITGNSGSSINTFDLFNTNFVGNNFLFLKVQHFGHFKGNLVGWNGGIYETPDYFILYMLSDPDILTGTATNESLNTGDDLTATSSSTLNKVLDIENKNDATVENIINLNANTGGNEAGRFNATIKTGTAESIANIVTMINTNIVGNHWYVGFINIFADFFGDIVFFKPKAEATDNATPIITPPAQIEVIATQSMPNTSSGVTLQSTPSPTTTPMPIQVAINKVSFPYENGLTLGVTTGQSCSNPLACFQGSILDGISTIAKTIPITAILFYCLGMATTILFSRRYFSKQ